MICTQKDEFLNEKTFWMIHLSDGTRVFQDDFRYGPQDSAWLRLKDYLINEAEPEISISKFFLVFRSHIEMVAPENALGYYFSKCAMRDSGWSKTKNGYVIGYLREDGIIQCNFWETPEIIKERQLEKRLEDIDKEYIIING